MDRPIILLPDHLIYIAIIAWVFYLFSRKTYIELTTMRGIFLVEAAAFDANHAGNLVSELNERIYNKNCIYP